MVAIVHKQSDVEQRKAPKLIKISEMERRQIRAKQEAEELRAARRASELNLAAEQAAKDEAQSIAAEVAKIEANTAAAAMKKMTLLSIFSKVEGAWAARANQQLKEVDGVLEAVKQLQRAHRTQVSSEQHRERRSRRVEVRRNQLRLNQGAISR